MSGAPDGSAPPRKRLSARDKAAVLDWLRKIERNTRGFDPMCNHGINHNHVVQAIKILTGA